MTRKEAYEELTYCADWAEHADEIYVDTVPVDALKIAIEALNQPKRKKGKWIGKPIAGYSKVRCSVCKDVFLDNAGRWNYCPNCGAKMEVE